MFLSTFQQIYPSIRILYEHMMTIRVLSLRPSKFLLIPPHSLLPSTIFKITAISPINLRSIKFLPQPRSMQYVLNWNCIESASGNTSIHPHTQSHTATHTHICWVWCVLVVPCFVIVFRAARRVQQFVQQDTTCSCCSRVVALVVAVVAQFCCCLGWLLERLYVLDNLPLIENRFVAEIALSTAIRFPYKLIIAAIDRSRDRLAGRAREKERKKESTHSIGNSFSLMEKSPVEV